MTNKDNLVFAPVSKAQEQFLNSEADFTFYGGGAGGGKSMCLLAAFLKYAHHPRTRGLIVRRTTKQITNAGGLFDTAVNFYKKVDPDLKVRLRDLELKFSSGATVRFGYLDKPADKYNFQGTEITFLGFDEVQQIPDEESVIYLLSRLRSTSVDYRLQCYATGNPDYNCFIRPWVEPYLDERGIPIRRESYPIRWFIRTGSSYEWFDSKEDMEAKHGPAEKVGGLSFCYIPSTVLDNPILMKSNPGYVAQLKALPRVEMERLLLGSWYAREEASGLFKREWCDEVPYPNGRARQRVRAWDLAFSKPSEVYPDPDWTRGVLISKDNMKVYTVEDVVGCRERVHDVEQLIFDTALKDGTGVVISIPQDPNAAASAYARGLQSKLAGMGFTVRLVKPVKSKINRFAPFSSVAQAGFVRVVKAEWNKDFYDELEIFDGSRKNHDDIVDACSDCMLLLNREMNLPIFSMQAMQSLPSKVPVGNFLDIQTNGPNFTIPTFKF